MLPAWIICITLTFFLSNWIFINFVISFQHYPGKVKINLHIPNSSPDILNIKSSPSSISPGGGNSIHIGLKKYSPVNGDTSTSADKKKISISLPLTPPAAPAVSAPVASAPAPPPVTSVSIYIKVNRSRCNNLGPYLDPKKVSDQLPEQVSLFPDQTSVGTVNDRCMMPRHHANVYNLVPWHLAYFLTPRLLSAALPTICSSMNRKITSVTVLAVRSHFQFPGLNC